MSWDGIAQVANIHFHSHLIHTWHDDVTKKQQEVARWGVTTLSKHTQCPMFVPTPTLQYFKVPPHSIINKMEPNT